MALIIKGDMPVSCFGCEMYEFWTACPLHNMAEVELESWKDTEGIHPSCPILGEMPDEHGRLIDADRLKGVIRKANEDCMFVGKYERAKQWSDAEFFVDHAPTIVEASK